MAVLARQADAVVGDADEGVPVAQPRQHGDVAAGFLLLLQPRLDRLTGILDQVGDGLGDEPAVEGEDELALADIEFDVDVGG